MLNNILKKENNLLICLCISIFSDLSMECW